MHRDTAQISNRDDLIDVRDVIARIEALEAERDDAASALEQADIDADVEGTAAPDPTDFAMDEDDAAELAALLAFMAQMQDSGGMEQWRGHWYPGYAVHDDYFEQHAKDEAESLGLTSNIDRWPATCIDWSEAADELKQDYTSVDFDGQTYWVRS